MTRQGCSVVSTEDAGNILDRLEGLSKVIPPELLEQALLETGRGKQKACRLSHRVMLWIVLAMGVLTHLPIRQVFKYGGAACGQAKRRPRAATSVKAGSVWVWSRCGEFSIWWFGPWLRRKRQEASIRGCVRWALTAR